MTNKFIRLTEVVGRNGNVPLIIPTDQIRLIAPSEKGTSDTHIRMLDDTFYFVKESLDQIWLMLTVDNTKAPVIMTADEALKYYAQRDGC